MSSENKNEQETFTGTIIPISSIKFFQKNKETKTSFICLVPNQAIKRMFFKLSISL